MKKLQTIEARLLCYPSYFGLLAILNALSHNNLLEASPDRQILKSSISHAMLKANFI